MKFIYYFLLHRFFIIALRHCYVPLAIDELCHLEKFLSEEEMKRDKIELVETPPMFLLLYMLLLCRHRRVSFVCSKKKLKTLF